MVKNKLNLFNLSNNKELLTNALIIFLVFFWFIGSYPAQMSVDSIKTFSQVLNLTPVDNSHTLFFYFYVYILSMGGRFIWTISLIQLIYTTAITYYSIKTFTTIKNKYVVKIALVFILLTPYLGIFPTTIWKDIPFTYLLIFGLTLLFKVNPRLFFGYLFIFLGLNFRLNGWLTLFIFALLLLFKSFFANKNNYNKISLSLMTISLLSYVTINFLPNLAKVENVSTWTKYSGFIHELILSKSFIPEKMSKTNLNFANSITEQSLDQNFKSCNNSLANNSIIPTFMTLDLNYDYLELNSNKIPQIWLSNLLDNPAEIINWRLCRTSNLIPFPFSPPPQITYWFHEGIVENNLGFVYKPLSESLNVFYVSIKQFWHLNESIIAWPGLHIFILMIIYFLVKIFNFAIRINVFLIFSISHFINLFITTTGFDTRYALLVTIIALIFTSIFLIEFIERRIRDLNP